MTMNLASRMLKRGTGTASISFRVPSVNSRPNTQLMTQDEEENPPAAIIWVKSPK